MDNLPTLKSSDLYECAYYFSNGCTVKNVEIVEENKKQICILLITGVNLLSLQQSYFKSQATINLFDFRRSYNRLLNIVSLAKKESKETSSQGGGK
jgi:hypothetical protein